MNSTYLALLATPALALVLGANPAQAAESHGLYLKADVGAATNTKLSNSSGSLTLDDGMSYSAGLGYDFGPIRVEGEARRISSSTNVFGTDVQASATNYSVNGFFEPIAIGNVTPYIMGGVGKLNGKLAVPIFGSISADATSYQWGAGAGFALTDAVTLDAGWRHIKADGLKGVDFGGDIFSVGARFKLA